MDDVCSICRYVGVHIKTKGRCPDGSLIQICRSCWRKCPPKCPRCMALPGQHMLIDGLRVPKTRTEVLQVDRWD